MLANLKEKASTYTVRQIKDLFLDRLKPLSPEAHSYCKGLFKHQEAQQVFTKLRDKQDREAVIQRILLPARQQYQQAEQRLHHFINNEQPPLNFASEEYQNWKQRRDELQQAADEARKKCDVEQNVGGVLDTVKSLKDLDDHSETYRLFATSLHYGYFVILVLFYFLYSFYQSGLWLFDRIPAQRRDLKKSQQKIQDDVTEIGKKVDEMQNLTMMLMQHLGETATAARMQKENSKSDHGGVVPEMNKVVPPSAVSSTTTATATTQTEEIKEQHPSVENELAALAMSSASASPSAVISKILKDFILSTNPVQLAMYTIMMIMMLIFERRMTYLVEKSTVVKN